MVVYSNSKKTKSSNNTNGFMGNNSTFIGSSSTGRTRKSKCTADSNTMFGNWFCNINNVTIFILIALVLVVGFLCLRVSDLGKIHHSTDSSSTTDSSLILPPIPPTTISTNVPIQDIRGDVGRCGAGGRTVGDPLTNPYVPPIRCDAGSLTTPTIAVLSPHATTSHGAIAAINVPTQSYNTQYAQVGILTRHGSNGDILPLMGRRSPNSRDKWQYYSVAGGGAGGNLQTKLPVKVKGRSCSGEYGCDEIYGGDSVYVEGYQDEFVATIYESGLFSYLPF
jgi:hypothetical protein